MHPIMMSHLFIHRVLLAAGLCLFAVVPAQASDTRFLMGFVHAHDGNHEAAIAVWEPLANDGHLKAQYALGSLYAEGDGVPVDMEKAYRWWFRAAEGGDTRAQFNIAGLLKEGLGTEQDEELAFEWMEHAARAGNVDAQLKLVEYYLTGCGVEADEAEAVFWLEVALLSGGNPISGPASVLARRLEHGDFDRRGTRARDWLNSR